MSTRGFRGTPSARPARGALGRERISRRARRAATLRRGCHGQSATRAEGTLFAPDGTAVLDAIDLLSQSLRHSVVVLRSLLLRALSRRAYRRTAQPRHRGAHRGRQRCGRGAVRASSQRCHDWTHRRRRDTRTPRRRGCTRSATTHESGVLVARSIRSFLCPELPQQAPSRCRGTRRGRGPVCAPTAVDPGFVADLSQPRDTTALPSLGAPKDL
jgi:hypothetical protein